ncbi:phage tail tape measure protein [Sporosarcina saromensis]|uniref:Phage tail tape measure protein n=1 Tax=Sporosarcina saromensis TaxID=359365 RepID=A0ABU4G9X4_9BACL|nr:phage tail tape measure protein [Sporosarcina saromensis]MDW0113760.1 phage tail tape measure protein [Sporosarcina saromensis]
MSKNIGDLKGRITMEASGFKEKMAEARSELDKTANSSQNLARDFDAIQKGALIVGGAVIAGIGSSVKVAADFEQSMARVNAISGATEEEFAQLEKTARKLGASTQYSASEAAEGMSYLAMAGFNVNETIAAMPGVLNLAAAAQVGLGSSADIVSNILSGFGMNAEESGRAVDVLVKTMSSANTDLPMLGDAMKYVAPVAASLGLSMEETAAAVGKMSDAGIQGSQAGTALRAMLLQLANPTGAAVKLIKNLGIEVTDASGKMKQLPELVGHIGKKLEGMTKAQKTATAAQLVGTEAASGFLSLLEVGEDTLADFTKELKDSGGTAERVAKVQMDTLNGSFKEFQSVMEEVGIKVGNEFLPIFRDIITVAIDVVKGFGEIDSQKLKTVATFLAISTGVAALLSTIGKLSLALSAFAMTPVGAAIVAISLLGGAIGAAMLKSEESIEVNLDHARSLEEQSNAMSEQIDRYEDLREKNKLSNDELATFVDLQSRIALETDPQKIEAMQKQYDRLQDKSGLTNEEMATFLSLNDDIINKVPNSNSILTDQGNILLDNTDAAKSYNEQLLKELELELRKQAIAASQGLSDNIQKRTEALEKINSLAEDYLVKQQEIEVQEMRLAIEEEKLALAREGGNAANIAAAEERVEQEEILLQRLKDQNYELSGQIIEQEEIVNGIELQIQKGQEAYSELINYHLGLIDVTAEKGKEIEAIDKAIEKTKELRQETVEKYTVDGNITQEGEEQLLLIDEQLKKMGLTKTEVEKLLVEQGRLTDGIDDSVGSAKDLNYEMSKEIEKYITQEGFGLKEADSLNEKLEKPITKKVSVWEKITRFFTGDENKEKRHSGGIVGSSEPKMHTGGRVAEVMDSLKSLPMHNEIDVRLLRNEMVLTESQQANLFRLLDAGFSNNSSGSFNDDGRVVELLQIIAEGVQSGRDVSIVMDDREVGRILEPHISERQKLKESDRRVFGGGD